MTIRDVLAPALLTAFSDRSVRICDAPGPIAVFAAACPEVGTVSIHDDGGEATVVIENVTHSHVNPYDPDLGEDERARWIAGRVIEHLRDLFDDTVLLWSIDQGKGGGGWSQPFDGKIPSDVPAGADVFVWSRRLARPD